MTDVERLMGIIKRAEDAIFCVGAPLGSDNYFKIRCILREALNHPPAPFNAEPK